MINIETIVRPRCCWPGVSVLSKQMQHLATRSILVLFQKTRGMEERVCELHLVLK